MNEQLQTRGGQMQRRLFEEQGAVLDVFIKGSFIGDGDWVPFGTVDLLAWEDDDLSRVLIKYEIKQGEMKQERASGILSKYYLRFSELSTSNANFIHEQLSTERQLLCRLDVPDWERALEIQEIYRCTNKPSRETSLEEESSRSYWELSDLQWMIIAQPSDIGASLDKPFKWLADAILADARADFE